MMLLSPQHIFDVNYPAEGFASSWNNGDRYLTCDTKDSPTNNGYVILNMVMFQHKSQFIQKQKKNKIQSTNTMINKNSTKKIISYVNITK